MALAPEAALVSHVGRRAPLPRGTPRRPPTWNAGPISHVERRAESPARDAGPISHVERRAESPAWDAASISHVGRRAHLALGPEPSSIDHGPRGPSRALATATPSLCRDRASRMIVAMTTRSVYAQRRRGGRA